MGISTALITPTALTTWADQHLNENGEYRETHDPTNNVVDLERERQRLAIEARKKAFYERLASSGLAPTPRVRWLLDNLGNYFVPGGQAALVAEFAQYEAALADGNSPVATGPAMQKIEDRLGRFTLPEYLWDGVLVQGFCYSMTAQTGAGKTALAMRIAYHVATGKPLCGKDVERGAVVYLAGENPDDVDMRWLGLFHTEGARPADLNLHVIAGAGDLPGHATTIRDTCLADNIRPALIIVDTAAAYFGGDDENSNTALGNYARQLRQLCTLPGSPCVVVLCHPTKGAKDVGEMIPRGGGAFLNEVDGNIGVSRDGNMIGIQAVGKFRGPEFSPQHFALHTVADCPALYDHRHARYMPTVVIREMTEAGVAERTMEKEKDDISLLKDIDQSPGDDLRKRAQRLGCHHVTVGRRIERLATRKLIDNSGLHPRLTSRGQKELNALDSMQQAATSHVPFPVPGRP